MLPATLGPLSSHPAQGLLVSFLPWPKMRSESLGLRALGWEQSLVWSLQVDLVGSTSPLPVQAFNLKINIICGSDRKPAAQKFVRNNWARLVHHFFEDMGALGTGGGKCTLHGKPCSLA